MEAGRAGLTVSCVGCSVMVGVGCDLALLKTLIRPPRRANARCYVLGPSEGPGSCGEKGEKVSPRESLTAGRKQRWQLRGRESTNCCRRTCLVSAPESSDTLDVAG
jgi:hypothetical protein